MAKYKPLPAAQRERRKKVKYLIVDAKQLAESYRSRRCEKMDTDSWKTMDYTARLLDDLADVAEKYLKTTNQPD